MMLNFKHTSDSKFREEWTHNVRGINMKSSIGLAFLISKTGLSFVMKDLVNELEKTISSFSESIKIAYESDYEAFVSMRNEMKR
jgi:hypothetical protein